MIVPLVRKELLGSGRHGRYFAVRAGYLALLACIAIPALMRQAERMGDSPVFAASRMGREFVLFFGILQMILVALVAPAMAVGAISVERASGSLDLLHAAGVRPIQLALGKYAGRMAWLLLFLMSGLPLLFAGTLMGGVGLEAIALLFAHSVLAALLGTSLGFLFSGGLRHAVPAMVLSYLVLLALYVGGPLGMVLVDEFVPGVRFRDEHLAWASPIFATSLFTMGEVKSPAVWLTVLPHAAAALLFGLPVLAFLRPGAEERRVRAGADVAGARRRRATGSAVQGNPIAWRDARLARRGAATKILWWVYLLGGSVVLGGSALVMMSSVRPHRELGQIGIFLLVAAGGLMSLVVGSGSVVEERERHSMPLLVLSRLTSADILGGKVWGMLVYLWPAFALPVALSILFYGGWADPTPPVWYGPERLGADMVAIVMTPLLSAAVLYAGGSLGLLFSSFTRRTTTAATLAVSAALVYLVVPPVLYELARMRSIRHVLPVINPLVTVTSVLNEFGRNGGNRWTDGDVVRGMMGLFFMFAGGTAFLVMAWALLSTREEGTGT